MIDYKILGDSIDYYQQRGFVRIESPWLVPQYVDNITKPKDVDSFQLRNNGKCLVASGEQSFLYMYLKEFLPMGQFQTITPCFRQDRYDMFHSKYFMKNELIKTDVVNASEMLKLVEIAFDFFRKYLPDARVEMTDVGYDIMHGPHELGSYGIRTCEFLTWIFGTGCAEPRLSKVIKLQDGLSQ